MPSVSVADFLLLGPLGVFVLVGLLLVVLEAATLGQRRTLVSTVALLGTLAAGVASVVVWVQGPEPVNLFSGMVVADPFGMACGVLFSLVITLTIVLSGPHQREFGWESGEYYAVLLFAGAGMAMIAMAGDLVTVFLGIETMSIATYVLTGLRRGSRRSSEAAMKYFLMGAFATGFLLYGIALLYGGNGNDKSRCNERLHSHAYGQRCADRWRVYAGHWFRV